MLSELGIRDLPSYSGLKPSITTCPMASRAPQTTTGIAGAGAGAGKVAVGDGVAAAGVMLL